jgi:hypothetical protein
VTGSSAAERPPHAARRAGRTVTGGSCSFEQRARQPPAPGNDSPVRLMLGRMVDAEQLLRRARRPLVIGMGGGGDIVGALATAEFARLYDGANPVLGGLSWERRPIDPVPGPRTAHEIEAAEQLAPGVLLAGPRTSVRGREVVFAEARMARLLGQPTVLLTLEGGPQAIAAGLAGAGRRLGADAFVFVDVGGDVLAEGGERGLRSPLCDALTLAAANRLLRAGETVLVGVFGAGCDAELTPAEVLARLAAVAGAGGLCGMRGLTDAVARKLEQAIAVIPTEASALAVRAFRGAVGRVAIRGGSCEAEVSPLAACTFFLDVAVTVRTCGRLAGVVDRARTVEQASRALNRVGVRTELDLERAGVAPL